MSKGSRNRSANTAYWSSSYWDKPRTDGGEAVAEIKRLVDITTRKKSVQQDGSMPSYYWECECRCGYCEFATKADALDGNHGKFCGAGATVKRRKVL